MRKMLLLGSLLGLYACDDGDLQIEEVDFDASTIETCPGLDDTTETTFFFKIDGDEALLLTLAEGLIKNETSLTGPLTSTLPAASNLNYRFFSDDVSAAYFCDAVPPLEPTVLKENIATSGNISIDTKVDTLTADTKNYSHTISIKDLSLKNEQGEELTDQTTLTYGDFITRPANSAKLEVPFSNYSNIATLTCDAGPVEGSLRLYKILNDEFIALDVPDPDMVFKNEATPVDTQPTPLDLADSDIFKYVVLNIPTNNELACAEAAGQAFGDEVNSWRLVSTAGTLSVNTVAGEPDANGTTTYTHSISLNDVVLTSKATSADTNDVDLTAIPTIFFGTYVTTATAM